MTLEYLHLDVFTDRRFEGNQLAVFRDARGIDDRTMQTIAREMNFSESTFLLPAESADTDIRMRIFTPGVELPMAGHPTIGTTFALAHLGTVAPPRDHFVFGLGVGPTRVELRWAGPRLDFAWMDQRLPDVREPAMTTADVARAAGVELAAHTRTGLPAQEISCGVPYILLPLASRADVDAAEPDTGALKHLKSAFGVPHAGIYIFSTEERGDDVTAYSRMFAAGLGIAEDPATGSACGPLGCYLVQQGLVTPERAAHIVSWQGVAVGRPSRIHVAISLASPDASHDGDRHGRAGANAVSRVQVGGKAVVVASGTLSV